MKIIMFVLSCQHANQPVSQSSSQPANKQAELPVELILCDAWAVLNILGARVAR